MKHLLSRALVAGFCLGLAAGCGGGKIQTPTGTLVAPKDDPTKNTKAPELPKKDEGQ